MSITHIESPGALAAARGVIGPNAVTRVAQALSIALGDDPCRAVFAAAGLEAHLHHPPTHMVDEIDVAQLHRVLAERLGPTEAAEISRVAGRLTGDYLLANRIPSAAQTLLALLPRRVAAKVLVEAIARHSWTFVGSGDFSYVFAPNLQLRVVRSPICRRIETRAPACHYFTATFERVFAAMLGPNLRVVETECAAMGDSACVFDVSW